MNMHRYPIAQSPRAETSVTYRIEVTPRSGRLGPCLQGRWRGALALAACLLVVPLSLLAAGSEGSTSTTAESISRDQPASPSSAGAKASPYGPFRTDPAQGIPKHAYSPFDKLNQPPPYQPVAGRDFLPGRVVVRLMPPATSRTKSLDGLPDVAALERVFAAHGLTGVERVFPYARPPSRVALQRVGSPRGGQMPDLTRWLRARCPAGQDVFELVKELAQHPDVELAEPEYVRRLAGGSSPDPLSENQWHLAAAKVPEAWAYLESQGLPPGGNRDIVVAVIDSGVDYNHPDLAANMWVNSREIPGNGIDDDGNGFVDDVHGCSTVGNASSHSGNPMDDHGHGTHVAGIIASQANNGQGGVGVAHNIQILAVKAAQYSGTLASSDVAEGIQYAVTQGASVINMSFGGYAASQVEADALAVAFGQAILVAAAGNEGIPNEPCDSPIAPRALYPAAYNWVLGVMAQSRTPDGQGNHLAPFSNFDGVANTSIEYELMAPGVDVWSTLPGGQYAAWDGTSMAAPLVSGIAALARTRWTDKNLYPSRFIMGQVAAAGPLRQGRSAPDGRPSASYATADALAALTTVPKPQLSYLEHWLFDTSAQSPANDADGIVDANETIDLAVVVRNRWGKADPVQARLEARAPGAAQTDPYVSWITDTVDYGAIGSFSVDDNGLIYDAQQRVTGVQHPFRFRVSADCPNDHVIPFRLVLTARNGLDPADPAQYPFESRFSLIVQRGRELPRIISQDLTLTKDYYWLVPDRTLVESRATLTIEAGTQVQFWSSGPNSPYYPNPNALIQVEGTLDVQGTAAEPVELFNSTLLPKAVVNVFTPSDPGRILLRYARVRNPLLTAGLIDHCYFTQQSTRYGERPNYLGAGTPQTASYSIYRKMGGEFQMTVYSPTLRQNLFEGCDLALSDKTKIGQGNVFFPTSRSSAYGVGFSLDRHTYVLSVFPTNVTGGAAGPKTYFAISLSTSFDAAEQFARQFGGHLVTVNDAAENSFLLAYRQFMTANNFARLYPNLINIPALDAGRGGPFNAWEEFREFYPLRLGLVAEAGTTNYVWVSGEPLAYQNWNSGHPVVGPRHAGMITDQGHPDKGRWIVTENGPWIAEVPGTWSQAQIDAVRQAYLLRGEFNQVKHNAFLNRWWDFPSWMRLHAEGNRANWVYLTDNFWGTTSTNLIDALLYDYQDDFNKGRYIYQPILTNAPVECYPFVASLRLSTSGSPDTMIVGAEDVTFTVTFNRDMNTAVQPQVSFGPAAPLTDYLAHPIDGGWRDARTWTGVFQVTSATGDGYQLVRIAGAVAADDPWLVTGDDAGRFRFEIVTSGTESMTLQATGGEAKVDLAWMQDDFDLLAGYNLYRSSNPSNNFARINPTIVPSQQKTYRDAQVQPGQPYYYKFTVVKTDMTESGFSNVAQGTPRDTIPPVIVHTPVTVASPGLALTLLADVTDNVGVQAVTLFFRLTGGANPYEAHPMTRTAGNRYAASLEGARVTSPGLDYYLEATDGISTALAGRPERPNTVLVADRPVVTAATPGRGPASGGTALTVVGANFRPVATVTVGGLPATQVIRVDSSRLTCVTPAHFPAAADIVVTNPDGQSGMLLRAFIFESDTVSLSLPNTGGAPSQHAGVPVNAANVQGLAAVDLTVTFNAAVLRGRGARTGSLTPGWSLVVNTATPGQMRLSLAAVGGTAAGEGSLAILEFEVIGVAGSNSPLRLANASLNDGAVRVQPADGSFAVAPAYNVSGTIAYWHRGTAVADALLTLDGDRVFTGVSDPTGRYTVQGAPSGAYTLRASKADGVAGITAYDGSLVLQHAAALNTLTGDAATAADVDKSGAITAMDAFYILQKAVDLIALPFPGAGSVWDFRPNSRTYPNLNGHVSGQDFVAVLLGDASGNWATGGPGLAATQGTGPGSVRLASAGVRSGSPAGASPAEAVILGLKRLPQTHSAGERLWLLARAVKPSVYSLDLTLALPSSASAVSSVRPGPMAESLTVVTNTNRPGQLRVAMAGAVPIAGVGGLLIVELPATENGEATILQASINEGAVPVQIDVTSLAFDQDTDADGQTDWQEIRAGTDPRNGQSRFAMLDVALQADGGVQIIWSAVPGRKYQLQTKAAVDDPTWLDVGDEVTANGSSASQVERLQPPAPRRIYRTLLVD